MKTAMYQDEVRGTGDHAPCMRRDVLKMGAMGFLSMNATATAVAQEVAVTRWPAKPVTVIVNVAPGSSVDVVARFISTQLQTSLGQTFVVENRSGVAGNIGAEAVARATPDGHTLLVSAASTITVNPFVYPQMKWNPFKELVPVAAGARTIGLLVARPGLDVKSLPEFLALAKSSKAPLTFASPGSGSVPHIAGEVFISRAGISATHIPYRGAAPALQDVLADLVDFVFDPGLAIPHIRAGKLKLLALAMPKRSALFPDTPTLEELGFKGLNASTIHGFYAPMATPWAVVSKINAEINTILALPAMRDNLMPIGAEPAAMSSEQFRKLLENEASHYGPIVKGMKIEAT